MLEESSEALLDQIKAVTGVVTASLSGLMIGVGYSWVVIGSLSDIDLLIDSASLELPLLGSKINPTGYLFAASAVLCILCVYVHISIVRLWSLYNQLPRQIDGITRSDRVAPWIGTALLPGSETVFPLAPIAALAAIVSVWLAPVLTIAVLGGRYVLVGQGLGLILWHAAAAMIAGIVAALSLWIVIRRGPNQPDGSNVPALVWGVGLLLFVAIVGMSATSVQRSTHVNTFFNTKVDFSKLNFLTRARPGPSETWRTYAEAKTAKFGDHCGNAAQTDTGCTELFNTFDEERRSWRLSFFPETDLSESRFLGANLRETVLEGADLRGIDLRGADLTESNLQDADLARADLGGATLMGADLESASILGANFSGTDLTGTNLLRAVDDYVGNPNEVPVRFDGAILVRTVTEESLLGTFKDALLIGSKTWSPFPDNDENSLIGALSTMAESGWGPNMLSWQFADAPTMQFVEHAGALSAEGAALRFLDLRDREYVVLSNGDEHRPIDFDSLFGDMTVLLPEGVVRPCHWAPIVASDEQFFARWRGWRDARGKAWPPSPAIGDIWIGSVLLFDLETQEPIIDPFGPNNGFQWIPGKRYRAKDVRPIPPSC